MLDYIKKRKKKAGGVQGRPIVDCRGGSSKPDTKRRPHWECVLLAKTCNCVLQINVGGKCDKHCQIFGLTVCVWIHHHRCKVRWRGHLSIPKAVLQRKVLWYGQWLSPGTHPIYLTAYKRKNWLQGYVVEWQIWVAAALDLGRHWIGILGFCTRAALGPYISW